MTRAPLWLTVAIYAAQHQDEHGDLHLRPGQLREAMGGYMSSQSVSHAIRRAVKYGLLRPGSSARCLRPTMRAVTWVAA